MSGAAEKLAKTIRDLEQASKSQGGQIANFEQALTDLKASLKEVKQAQDALNRAPASDTPSDVDKAYAVPAANRDKVSGGVADLSRGQKLKAGQGRWVGSSGGVVRLLGGMERGRWAPGLLDDPTPKNDWQREAQERAEEIAWVKAFRGEASRELWQGLADHMKAGPPQVAKVFADNAGEGGEFIVSIPMTMLERTAELERQVEALLMTLDVPSSTVTMPFLTTGAQPFIHGQPVAGDNNPGVLPKSVPSTAERTINVRTLTVNIPVDRDAAEDSIIAAIPLMQRLAGEALRDGSEDCLINGDTAATHGDTAFGSWNPRSRWQVLGSSVDHRKAWIGFRQRAFDLDATVTTAAEDQSGAQTVADYIGELSLLTSPHGMGDVVYITSPEHYLKKILTDTNLLTVDKYGPSAVVVTGEVGRIGKHRLVLSEFVTADLATTGLYTGAGNSKTGMLIVNLARFLMARRRSLRIEVETVIRENTVYVVASERKTLHTFDGSSTVNCRWLYNLDA